MFFSLLDELVQNSICRVIVDIQRDIEKQLKRSWFNRFLHLASIASLLEKRTQDLEDAREGFNVSLFFIFSGTRFASLTPIVDCLLGCH